MISITTVRHRISTTRSLAAPLKAMCMLSGLLLHASNLHAAGADDTGMNPDTIPDPRPYHAEYEARSHGMSSTAIRELQRHDAGLYRLSQGLEVRLLGARVISIDESSHFAWVDNHAIPGEYRYRQRGISRRDERLYFDWQARTADYVDRNGEGSHVIETDVLDPLGFTAQLSADVKAAILTDSGRIDFEYQILDVDRYAEHLYRITGEEELDTPAGTLNTVLVERVREPDSPRSTRIWLAIDHDFVLARLEQISSNGSNTELALKSIDWR